MATIDELRRHASADTIALNPEVFGTAKPHKTRAIRAANVWDSERQFTAQVVTHIRQRWPHLIVAHVPNENSHTAPGVAGGFPDLIIIAEHGVMFIELKVTRADGSVGELRPTQVMMIDKLRAMGCRVEVVTDDLDECIRIVGEWDNENQTRP